MIPLGGTLLNNKCRQLRLVSEAADRRVAWEVRIGFLVQSHIYCCGESAKIGNEADEFRDYPMVIIRLLFYIWLIASSFNYLAPLGPVNASPICFSDACFFQESPLAQWCPTIFLGGTPYFVYDMLLIHDSFISCLTSYYIVSV